ncbi:MAG: helix-turn-helix transcriptional regulator [Saprospiraceae bacterium]|nr:helix-turn-helix transcriptional regulator [Candidatus Opimibacter iunctus]
MHQPDKPDLRIRAYREAKGYTQEYMAEMLSICQSTYANLESGKTTLSITRLLHIADILETDFTNLLEFRRHPLSQNHLKGSHGNHGAMDMHQETKGVYDQLIQEMRSEIAFLRSLIRTS